MKLLLLALLLVAIPAAAQTETPTNTPTETPTNTPTHTATPTNTPTATVAATITPIDEEVRLSDVRKRISTATLSGSGAVGVVEAPGTGYRNVVHSLVLSSTAAASVQVRIGTVAAVAHMAAGVPWVLPAPLYGDAGSTVVLTRTAGAAAVDAVIWSTRSPVD